MKHRRSLHAGAALTAAALVVLSLSASGAAVAQDHQPTAGKGPLKGAKHLVVIYEENHSFDNLYGNWGPVGGKHVRGRSDATKATTTQVSQLGAPYTCLMQKDVNLTSPPNTARSGCSPETVPFPDGSTTSYSSHFANAPFRIDSFIAPKDKTCPPLGNLFGFPDGVDKNHPPTGARAGGCTRDLVHKFYQEIYQLNGGRQNRYVTGSDAVGLSMGHYDTKALPLYRYLHKKKAPHYVLADNFFQGAFGGSYLNHQYLIAAQPPLLPAGAPPSTPATPANANAVLDSNGQVKGYPLYKPTAPVVDGNLTQACGAASAANHLACGNWTVNTSLPATQPTADYAPKIPMINDTKLDLNIGDRLSDAKVSWAWYAGGWDNAAGKTGGRGYTNGTGPNCGDPNSAPAPADTTGKAGFPFCPHRTFQQHHQPFDYFARYAPGTTGRARHLKDEKDFLFQARKGTLPKVSFVKPLGEENEHPGYASEPDGSDHLVDLVKAIQAGPDGKNTLILVTYDEFGGQWDHVTPPGLGGRKGPHDRFGPGTRVPAVLIGRPLTRSTVDHQTYDTTSVLATIEKAYGLKALDHPAGVVPRDRFVSTLGHAVTLGTAKQTKR